MSFRDIFYPVCVCGLSLHFFLFGCEDRVAIFAGEDRFAISWPWAFK